MHHLSLGDLGPHSPVDYLGTLLARCSEFVGKKNGSPAVNEPHLESEDRAGAGWWELGSRGGRRGLSPTIELLRGQEEASEEPHSALLTKPPYPGPMDG